MAFCVLAAALILAEAAGLYFYFSPKLKPANYDDLVTAAGTLPLPVPTDKIKAGRTFKIPILMYHHVGDIPANADGTRADLTVPAASFAQQVAWLARNGYAAVSLNDLHLLSQGRFNMPKKPVIFTFDDGYEDVFLNAEPILKKYGYTGSFGIITQNPGTVQGDNIYATWSEIASAYLDGNEIVSHTQNHFDGTDPKFSPNDIYRNLAGSITDINRHLGFNTSILIYPYGHYNATYLAQAKKTGFIMGVTVHEGDIVNLDDLMQIPRIRVHGSEDLQRFINILLYGDTPKPEATSTPAALK